MVRGECANSKPCLVMELGKYFCTVGFSGMNLTVVSCFQSQIHLFSLAWCVVGAGSICGCPSGACEGDGRTGRKVHRHNQAVQALHARCVVEAMLVIFCSLRVSRAFSEETLLIKGSNDV